MSAREPEPRYRLLGVVPREVEQQKDEELPDDAVFTWPHFLIRHAVVAGGVIVVVFALAIAFQAPLKDIANPSQTPAVAKAPWYFAGLQELLSHFDPLIAGILVPAGAVLTLVLLPYIDHNPATEARNRKVAVLLFTVIVVIAVGLTVIGTFFRGPGWQWIPPWDHWYVEL
jgi:menaquinol-cytochrome c reductase cytochrome b/c subunit